MKRLIYGMLSGLVIMSAAMPAKAETQPVIVAQSEGSLEQMYYQQRVLTEEIQSLMTQMKVMMAEMKALSSLPSDKSVTMNDLYKQQQLLDAKVDALIGRTRLDTIAPRTDRSATVQNVYQQQVSMVAEIKEMMAELKQMMAAYRGRATNLR